MRANDRCRRASSRRGTISRRVTVADILRAAGTVDEPENGSAKNSRILDEIVLPAVADAERAFTAALTQLSLEDLTRRAEGLRDRS